MWRDRVYSGTLRQRTNEVISAAYLSNLLDGLTATVRTNNLTKVSPAHDVNCIDTGVYLGDRYAATDKHFLMKHGFTHVLNAAEGHDEYQVNTNQNYYKDAKIKYFGIPGHDRPSWNIGVYFEEAAKFINDAVSKGGKVLVHCVVGISRSATIILAYLMLYRGMNAAEALQFTFRRRRVFPNPGFLQHLANLNTMIVRQAQQQQARRYLVANNNIITTK